MEAQVKPSEPHRWNQDRLDALLAERRRRVIVKCRMLRPLAGGQPAGEAGIKAFVQYQCQLAPGTPEFDAAVARIQKQEIGEREVTPETGEVPESESYAVNVLRRSAHGPFVLEHQVKAMLKQAASRLGIFKAKIGSKGNLAELGTVAAHGASLVDPKRPWEIYLVDDDGKPVVTTFKRISGRVGTPRGEKSIQHDTELAPEGTQFAFSLAFLPGAAKAQLTEEDIALIVAAASKIGLGSCLSLEYGRFESELEVY